MTVLSPKTISCFWNHVSKDLFVHPICGPCWIWIGAVNNSGYGFLNIAKSEIASHRTKVTAHRLSWMIHRGPIPIDLCVLHKCDVPVCVNPDHLWLGTPADNSSDMVSKCRAAFGEANGSAKLTTEDIIAIKALYKTGRYSQSSLARVYDVWQTTICQIVHGKSWSHAK